MVRVLIVARTQMGSNVCIGGLNLETNESLRLLGSDGSNQPRSVEFDVGQVWEIDYTPSQHITLPHTEDVFVQKSQHVGRQPHLRDFLLERIHPWCGGADQLFDGLLVSERGSCYLPPYPKEYLPQVSTGLWLPETPLKQSGINSRYYIALVDTKPYAYEELGIHDEQLYIKYVGFSSPIRQLPAQTLIRVSLARWWNGEGRHELRCYLQLSGWYL